MNGFSYSHGRRVECCPGRIIIDVPVEEADMAVKMIRIHQEYERREREQRILDLPLDDLVAGAWAAPFAETEAT